MLLQHGCRDRVGSGLLVGQLANSTGDVVGCQRREMSKGRASWCTAKRSRWRVTNAGSYLGDFLSEELVKRLDVDCSARRDAATTKQPVHDTPQLSRVGRVSLYLTGPKVSTPAMTQLTIHSSLSVPRSLGSSSLANDGDGVGARSGRR